MKSRSFKVIVAPAEWNRGMVNVVFPRTRKQVPDPDWGPSHNFDAAMFRRLVGRSRGTFRVTFTPVSSKGSK